MNWMSPRPDQLVKASTMVNTIGMAPNSRKSRKYGETAPYWGSDFLMRCPVDNVR